MVCVEVSAHKQYILMIELERRLRDETPILPIPLNRFSLLSAASSQKSCAHHPRLCHRRMAVTHRIVPALSL